MKLLRLEVKGFRSFRDISWEPADLNVVIGPNASGKSNLLFLLEFLAAVARGGLRDHVQRCGGMGSLLWDGRAEALDLRCTFAMPPAPGDPGAGPREVVYSLRLGRLENGPACTVLSEVLGDSENHDPFFRREGGVTTSKPGTFQDRSSASKALARVSVAHDDAFLAQYTGAFVPEASVPKRVCAVMASWAVYPGVNVGPDAEVRNAPVAQFAEHVAPDGQNLVQVLHTLYAGNQQFERDSDLAMRAAFGVNYEKLTFPPASDQRVHLRIRWRGLQRTMPQAELSDGTLRFLFLLAVLGDPKVPPLVAIDEPELGLHPSMLPIVAEYARDAARKSMVVLTTHSAQFLDAFGEDRPATTVMRNEAGETQMRLLTGAPLDDWLTEYSLGDLYRSGELEGLLADPPTSEIATRVECEL